MKSGLDIKFVSILVRTNFRRKLRSTCDVLAFLECVAVVVLSAVSVDWVVVALNAVPLLSQCGNMGVSANIAHLLP